jgi:hypothetical protein
MKTLLKSFSEMDYYSVNVAFIFGKEILSSSTNMNKVY